MMCSARPLILLSVAMACLVARDVVHAWSFQSKKDVSPAAATSAADAQLSRRKALQTTTAAFLAVGTTLTTTMSHFPQSVAWADVSDGNALPDGAAQFARVVRAKADLQVISKRVTQASAGEMDKKEWENVGGFLRRIYGLSEDMKGIANGMDATKKKQASELAESIKKLSKAADGPAGNQNGAEFVNYANKMESVLGEFLALLQDVPDEL